MKIKTVLVGILCFYCSIADAQDSTAKINTIWADYVNDTSLTLQQIIGKCDSQFAAAGYSINHSDVDSEKDEDGTAFVEYLKWKAFWSSRYDLSNGKLHRFAADAASRLTGVIPGTNCEGQSTLQNTLSSIPSFPKGWEFIGPQNMDQRIGQVNSIIVNPSNTSEIYAADAFGGLWKTTNANSAPNNTWTCLSDHLPSMSGIGITSLYVDFASIPHHLFCLIGIPYSLCIKNNSHTVGIFYSTDDGSTFSQMNLTSIIPDLTGNTITDMKYWPGNSTSSHKYLFISTQYKIFRIDITNLASVNAITIADMTTVVPTDNQSGRYPGFNSINFLSSDPTIMYAAANSNNGNGFSLTADLYKIINCNTCTSCTLNSMTLSLTSGTGPDYLNGSGQFTSLSTNSPYLPNNWVTDSWQGDKFNHNAFLAPDLGGAVGSIEVPVAGSYADNMNYVVTFDLVLPPKTEVDVLLSDVESGRIYTTDWGYGSTAYPTPVAVADGSHPDGHFINNSSTTNLPVHFSQTISSWHYVDRLEFGGYALSGYSSTVKGNITLTNVTVNEPYQDYIYNLMSPLTTSGYLYCISSTDHNGAIHNLQKIQDLGTSYNVTAYNVPGNIFSFSSVNSNILYCLSNHDNFIYKYDLAHSTSSLISTGLHTDSRSTFFLPNSTNTDDIIYVGEDGGIGMGSFGGSWQSLDGKGMKTSFGFDIGSSIHTGEVGLAATDNGVMASNSSNFNSWQGIFNGYDGAQIRYGKRYITRNIRFVGYSKSSGFLILKTQNAGTIPNVLTPADQGVSVPTLGKLVTTYKGEYFGSGDGKNNIFRVDANLNSGHYDLSFNSISNDLSFAPPLSINNGEKAPVQAIAPDEYDSTFMAAYMHSAPWDYGYLAFTSNADVTTPTWTIKDNSPAAIICMVADPRLSSTGKRLWVGAGGYASTAESNRVFQTTDGGGTWADMSYGLPIGPVNALAYDEQSRYLFAGTDQGVYAFNVDNGPNSASNPWVCYSLNLPNSFVTGFDINRCTGKIYVSTYGRGAYQAELPPDPNATGSYTTGGANGINDICDIDKIASSTTWNQDRDETRSIYIPAGVTLTIQNCTINMGRDKSIIVAPKGKLIVDNATITNSCGYMWRGIEARGDMTKPQYAYNQSTVIIKNNSTIQYAQTAIANWNISGSDYNSTGGIIQVSNSTFSDNHIAASFAPYRGTYLSMLQKDFSYFALTNFTIDNNYRDYNGAYPFQEHVAILQDDGVTFAGCNFSNTKNSGYGIYAMDAGVYVLPYYSAGDAFKLHPRRGQFSGFLRGIDIESSKGLSPLTSVDNIDFNSCGIGVFVSAINDVSITRSGFSVGLGPQITQVSDDPCPQNIGIYMKNASPFQIEQNTFTGNPSSSITNYGTVVENAKYYYDDNILHCTFGSLNYGCVAVGNNGEGTNPGLHILCNSFSNNTTDIGLEPLATIPTQGSTTTSTGNTFASGAGTIVDNGSSFWYYYNGTNSLPTNISPAHSVFFKIANAANACASTFGGDPAFPTRLTTSGLVSLKAGFKNAKPTWQGYANQYKSLMDGGCTSCRVNQIQGNTQGIYNTLMGETPYLSSTVLSAAGSANHFSYSQYYNLLYACPEALRDNDLMNFIQYSIPNPISQQDIAALRQRANTNTSRTTLESEIYDTHTTMSRDALSIIQALKVNTDTTWLALDTNSTHAQYDSTSTYAGIDSVGVWLQNIGDLSSQYQLVGYYLAMGNLSAASSALNSVPNMFQLSADETTEYNHYNTIVNTLINMKNSGRNLAQLTNTELNNIYSIGADNSTDDGQIIAADIINFGGGIGFPLPPNRFYPIPCLPLMWTGGKPEGAIASSNMQEYNGVEAYPNPAKDNVTFKYDITKINGKAHLTVTDIVGTLKVDIPVDNVHGYIDWSTDKVSPGVYIYRLSDATKTIGTGKLTIIK